MREIRLFISVPSCREWKPSFGSSFTAMNCNLVSKGIGNHKLTRIYPEIAAQASCLSRARQLALNKAIAGNFTHWLSLDDDMLFPNDVVDRLLAHDKPVVTANYRRKNADNVLGVCMGLDGQIINSTGKTGIENIGWMGGGLFLADIQKIKSVPAPHFEVVWCEERQDYYDQDMYFSMKVRHHGHEIWCDHDLSQEVVHVGDYNFSWPEEILKPRLVSEAA